MCVCVCVYVYVSIVSDGEWDYLLLDWYYKIYFQYTHIQMSIFIWLFSSLITNDLSKQENI